MTFNPIYIRLPFNFCELCPLFGSHYNYTFNYFEDFIIIYNYMPGVLFNIFRIIPLICVDL